MSKTLGAPQSVLPIHMLAPAADAAGRTASYFSLKNYVKLFEFEEMNNKSHLVNLITNNFEFFLVKEYGRVWQEGCDWGYEEAKKDLKGKIKKYKASYLNEGYVNFTNYLADECHDEKKYGDCEYDEKIWNYIINDILKLL